MCLYPTGKWIPYLGHLGSDPTPGPTGKTHPGGAAV